MKKTTIGNRIFLIIISSYLLIPLLLTFVFSIFNEWTSILPENLTFKFYGEIISDALFWESLGRSVFIAILPVILCTICLLLVFYVMIVHCPKIEKYVEIVCTIPYAIQGVILAVGILSLYAGSPTILSDRFVLLIGAYCIIILPYMYRGLKNSLNTIPVIRLLEAAQMLGCTKLYAFIRVIVPNMLSGIMISMMLSISIVFGDFVIVNIIGGSYYQTASIYLYNVMAQSGQKTSAVVVFLFITTLLMSITALYLESKTKKKGIN